MQSDARIMFISIALDIDIGGIGKVVARNAALWSAITIGPTPMVCKSVGLCSAILCAGTEITWRSMKIGRFQLAANSRSLPRSLGASAKMPALAPKAFRMSFPALACTADEISRSDEVPYSADRGSRHTSSRVILKTGTSATLCIPSVIKAGVVSQDVGNQAGGAQGSTLNCQRKVGPRWITLAKPGAVDRV